MSRRAHMGTCWPIAADDYSTVVQASEMAARTGTFIGWTEAQWEIAKQLARTKKLRWQGSVPSGPAVFDSLAFYFAGASYCDATRLQRLLLQKRYLEEGASV